MTPQPRAARTVAEGVGGARMRGRRAGVTLTLAAIVAAAPAGCAWDANVPVQTGATALTGSAGTTTPSGGAGAATNAGGAGATTPASGASSPTSGADQTAPYPELLPRTIGDAALEVSLTRLSPSIATPDAAVSIDVTIANRGLTAAKPAVTARVGEPLSSRADLDAPLDVAGTTVVSDSVPAPDIAPQGSASVRLTIPAQRLASAAAYGVRPLLVRAETAGGSAAIRTYLPFEQRKEYEPLSLAVAVPLTQDLDPARSGADPAAAERAWARSTAAGSRLDRILTGTAGAAVTYAVDPSLLGPVVGPGPGAGPTSSSGTTSPASATTSSSSTGSTAAPNSSGSTGSTSSTGTSAPGSTGSTTGATATPSAPTSPVVTVGATPPPSPARAAFAKRLADLAKTHPIWDLPSEDPDVAALLSDDISADDLPGLLAGDARVRAALAPASGHRVAWPVVGLSADQVRRLTTAYGQGWSGPIVLPLTGSQQPGWTGDAARRFGDGPTVLAYDETLSRLLADTAGTAGGVSPGLTQRFLAETMTILQEFPGRPRRLLAVAPRDFDPDPTTLAALLRTAESTPWLRTASTDSLLAEAQAPTTPAAIATDDPAGRPEPFPSGSSPLDRDRVDDIEADLQRVAAFAAILPSGSATPATARSAGIGLLSARWRGHGIAWDDAHHAVQSRIDTLLNGVSVVDSQVNFFAESGTLQVTVLNTLDVDVRDVQLHLIAQGRTARLRLPSTPYVLNIAARSRATVKVPVEAIAAGPAVVSAQVSSPDGTRLGAQDATLAVEVQPNTGRLVVGIGGAAAVVFLVGLFRTIRRNRPRVTAEDLKEIDLE